MAKHLSHDEFQTVLAMYILVNSKPDEDNPINEPILDAFDILKEQRDQFIPWVCVDKAKKKKTKDVAYVAINRIVHFDKQGDKMAARDEIKNGINETLKVVMTTEGFDIMHKGLKTIVSGINVEKIESTPNIVELLNMIVVGVKKELNEAKLYQPSALELATNP